MVPTEETIMFTDDLESLRVGKSEAAYEESQVSLIMLRDGFM